MPRTRRGRPFAISSAMTDPVHSSIAFLDSGLGGLPYLQWVRRRRPDLRFTYFADTENFPYGERREHEVRDAAVGAARRIFARGTPKLLALACNTASLAALEEIRSFAPCPVVGTVPAVKPAAERPDGRPIGVLATRSTIDSPCLDALIASFAPDRRVIRSAAGDIVRYVEESLLGEADPGPGAVMLRALESLREAKVGSVVIGCTHFLHILDFIADHMGAGVQLVDSREGVGRRILELIRGDRAPENSKRGTDAFFVTRGGKNTERCRMFARLFGLKWAGAAL